jgi:hypothetical protein
MGPRARGPDAGARRAPLRIAASLLAAAAASAAFAQPPARADAPACQPLEAPGDGLPDLQQALLGACQRLFPAGEGGEGTLASRLRIRAGGWIDGGYLDNDLAGRGASVDLDHVNLHLDARLDDRLQAFVEGEYEHERDITGFPDERQFELEQGYLQYAFADALALRAGKFSLPFGYWTPVHWSVSVDTIEAPLHEANRMVPEQQLGGRVHGRLFPDLALRLEPSVEYSGSVGYGADRLDTGKPEGWNADADLRLWSGDEHFLGASFYTQENSEIADREEYNLMLYGQVELPMRLLARSEYLHQWRAHRPGYTRDADVVYASLRFGFHERAYLNYRFQFGDDDKYGFTANHVIHTLTLGWRPTPRVIAKLETASHDLDEGIESYLAWGASLGLLF